MVKIPIPDIVVSRLPLYLQMLQLMQLEGKLSASSKEMGKRLGISAAQIRKDLSQFGEFGKQGTGYSIPFLIDQLRDILNVKKTWDIILVGAGDLGHAIARYQGFTNRGFRVAMVFDSDSDKIGKKVGNCTVEDIVNLKQRVHESGIRVALLTVPSSSAQVVAELLVQAGVCAILNYAPIQLSLPPGIQVRNTDPILQLQHMTYYMAR